TIRVAYVRSPHGRVVPWLRTGVYVPPPRHPRARGGEGTVPAIRAARALAPPARHPPEGRRVRCPVRRIVEMRPPTADRAAVHRSQTLAREGCRCHRRPPMPRTRQLDGSYRYPTRPASPLSGRALVERSEAVQ